MNTKFSMTILSVMLGVLAGAAGAADLAGIKIMPVPDNLYVQPTTDKSAAQSTFIYIVQLKGEPVVSYTGDISGYKATKPGKGKKINRKSEHVKNYVAHLERHQDQTIASVGGRKVYNYRYSINAFAARMTAADAKALKGRSDVVNVWRDEIRQIQTDTTPKFIGLTKRGEAWSNGLTGEDIVIGMVDTGIWPEHPSFADVKTQKNGNKGRKIPFGPIPDGFTPSGCDFGNTAANANDAAFSCNNKLVAARCYNLGFSSAFDTGNPCGGDGVFAGADEFQSARDNDGHGSHTASTAGGNSGVEAEIGGNFIGKVSGMAPRARIAAYKVCWDGGCASSDSMAAIDQAVADGVDVINYSIGGASTSFVSPADIAFLFAADSGVFVATSNGNGGPGAQTVGTPAGVPWVTGVGANQDDHVFNLAIIANTPADIAGSKVAIEGVSPVSLSDTGVITDDVTLTSPADGCGLSVAPISGIALSIRGTCGFAEKYNNAAAAGAVAIIVYNDGTTPARVDPIVMGADGTTIPGVMISFNDGDAMATAAGVNATLNPSGTVSAVDRVAGFSSRGPNGGAPDIIKPDLGAPGVNILAAETGDDGELFQIISGTSMSSPHVAGAFALLKQAHPDWSPAQARSALMTTARQDLKKTFGDTPADPFDIGAGAIAPSDAVDPGLTYDAGFFNYLAFSCDNNVQLVTDEDCATLQSLGFPIDGSDLNMPSIGIASLVGVQTITRTVTMVAGKSKPCRERGSRTGKADGCQKRNGSGGRGQRFDAYVDAPAGVDVSVSPSRIILRPGESATYQVTFSVNDSAVFDQWSFGSLTWTRGRKYSVRSPIAVRPTKIDAAVEVGAGGVAGSADIQVGFGYSGDYHAVLEGLAEKIPLLAGNVDATTHSQDIWCVGLPALTHLRVTSRDADTTNPGLDDVDLRLFVNSACSLTGLVQLGAAAGATSEEIMDVENAPAGIYLVVVDYFAAGVGDSINYVVNFTLIGGDEGNAAISAAPAEATAGTAGVVTVDYSGLNPGSRYLGVVLHEDENGEVTRTRIDVNTD